MTLYQALVTLLGLPDDVNTHYLISIVACVLTIYIVRLLFSIIRTVLGLNGRSYKI